MDQRISTDALQKLHEAACVRERINGILQELQKLQDNLCSQCGCRIINSEESLIRIAHLIATNNKIIFTNGLYTAPKMSTNPDAFKNELSAALTNIKLICQNTFGSYGYDLTIICDFNIVERSFSIVIYGYKEKTRVIEIVENRIIV